MRTDCSKAAVKPQGLNTQRGAQRLGLLLLTALVGLSSCATADEPTPDPSAAGAFMKGVTVSCYRSGPGEWDSPAMEHTLDELGTLGVNAVAIHPYARLSSNGTVRYRPGPVTPATVKPLDWAHDRSMSTLLKPHIAYWGSGFAWRGAITFVDDAAWKRFFAGYRHFIVEQAKLAAQTDATWFAVGTELAGTLQHEAEWRSLVAEVRGVYSGKLTYAANWDEVGKVPFWDALDAVGVQAYYPLSSKPNPSEDMLRDGWAKRLKEIDGIAARYGKPVILTELGYAVSEAAAERPWDDAVVGDHQRGAALKLRAMQVALAEIANRPDIVGVFLWKWFPGEREHGDEFVLQYPAMKKVIADAWSR